MREREASLVEIWAAGAMMLALVHLWVWAMGWLEPTLGTGWAMSLGALLAVVALVPLTLAAWIVCTVLEDAAAAAGRRVRRRRAGARR